MEYKWCFVNGHCCYDCPNFQLDIFEEKYDLPAGEIGLEKTTCKECYLNTGECKDCYFHNTPDCPERKEA